MFRVMPPGCFGFQYPSNASVFLGFATLENDAYGFGHRQFAAVKQTMDLHAPFPLTACIVSHL